MVQITEATSQEDCNIARELFKEYARSLKADICFENLDKELEELPGAYAPPGGRLLFASVGTRVGGCVAIKKAGDDVAEMKRLFVRPEFRGKGIGKKLVLRAMDEARSIGYSKLRLDTLPEMKEAIVLYRTLGFELIPPFRDLPIHGALFMQVKL